MSRNPNICPTHPGELLREDLLPAMGQSMVELAQMFGISLKHLNEVLAERQPVSPEFAVRLAKLFGNEPLFWIKMQEAYDAWRACQDVDVSRVT